MFLWSIIPTTRTTFYILLPQNGANHSDKVEDATVEEEHKNGDGTLFTICSCYWSHYLELTFEFVWITLMRLFFFFAEEEAPPAEETDAQPVKRAADKEEVGHVCCLQRHHISGFFFNPVSKPIDTSLPPKHSKHANSTFSWRHYPDYRWNSMNSGFLSKFKLLQLPHPT